MTGKGRELARAAALTLAAALVAPVNALVLLAVPAALMLLAFGRRSPLAVGAAALALAAVFRGLGAEPTPLWLAERGWSLVLGGGFVAVTVVRADWSLTARGLAAVVAAASATGLAGWLRPGLLEKLDWWVRRDLSGAALAARRWLPDGLWGAADGGLLLQARGWQEASYPALLGLASLASLAAGWCVLQRVRGREGALGPFREFAFSDHLFGLLVAALGVVAAPAGETITRLGGNVALFIGGLYLLRGLAVVFYVVGEATASAWSAALWAAAGVLLYPLALPAVLLVGLGDAWTDARTALLDVLGTPRDG